VVDETTHVLTSVTRQARERKRSLNEAARRIDYRAGLNKQLRLTDMMEKMTMKDEQRHDGE